MYCPERASSTDRSRLNDVVIHVYDHVTSDVVVRYDHVTSDAVVRYDHVTSGKVVSDDLMTTVCRPLKNN